MKKIKLIMRQDYLYRCSDIKYSAKDMESLFKSSEDMIAAGVKKCDCCGYYYFPKDGVVDKLPGYHDLCKHCLRASKSIDLSTIPVEYNIAFADEKGE